MVSHHASHRGRYVRPPTPRSAPGRPPRRDRRPRGCRPTDHPAAWSATPASCCDVPRRPRASGPGVSRCGTIPELPTLIMVTRGPDRSRARPHPRHAPPPPRHSVTPAPRHPGTPLCASPRGAGNSCLVSHRAARAPGLRARDSALRHQPGVADTSARRHERTAHGARRTSARHGHDATCTSALPSHARGTQAQAVVGGGSLSRRGRPGGRSRDRPVDRRGPTGPPRRAARRGAARPPARPVGRGRRCGRCGTASRRAPPRTAT